MSLNYQKKQCEGLINKTGGKKNYQQSQKVNIHSFKSKSISMRWLNVKKIKEKRIRGIEKKKDEEQKVEFLVSLLCNQSTNRTQNKKKKKHCNAMHEKKKEKMITTSKK